MSVVRSTDDESSFALPKIIPVAAADDQRNDESEFPANETAEVEVEVEVETKAKEEEEFD